MSECSTGSTVLLTNGLFARNPLIRGEGWFICFHPKAEIVLRKSHFRKDARKEAERILSEYQIAIDPQSLRLNKNHSRRSFDPFNWVLEKSISFFFHLTSPLNHKFITSYEYVSHGVPFQNIILHGNNGHPVPLSDTSEIQRIQIGFEIGHCWRCGSQNIRTKMERSFEWVDCKKCGASYQQDQEGNLLSPIFQGNQKKCDPHWEN